MLRFLASQPDPVPLDRIMRACDLPRSTAYHLVNTMIDEGFVVHLADDRRYGLGVAAFEVGTGYARQEPLGGSPAVRWPPSSTRRVRRAPRGPARPRRALRPRGAGAGRPPLVTDVGVRLPAHLTASGRAILSRSRPARSARSTRDRDGFVDRVGAGPTSPSALRTGSRRPGSAVTPWRTVR